MAKNKKNRKQSGSAGREQGKVTTKRGPRFKAVKRGPGRPPKDDSESVRKASVKAKTGKGRKSAARRERTHLSDDQVAKLRKKYKSGKYSQRALAAKYGIAQSYVCYLVNEQARA